MKSEEDVKNTIISNFLRPPATQVEGMPTTPLASNYIPKPATSTFKETIQQARDILTRGYLMMLGTSPEQVEQNRVSGNASKNIIPAVAGIAYHGSPYNFESFDPTKIGTGQGAAAFGHGFYFAENPAVAKDYQLQLSSPTIDDLREYFKPGNIISKDYYSQYGDKGDRVIKFNEGPQKPYGGNWLVQVERVQQDKSTGNWINLDKPRFHATIPSNEELEKVLGRAPGVTYKVDIPDETISKFLNWDKPISQQDPQVIQALKSYGVLSSPQSSTLTGENLYKMLSSGGMSRGTAYSRLVPEKAKQTSEFLNSIGIPGIQYLDQGSRSAGEGTRNFVVFDPSHIKILERK